MCECEWGSGGYDESLIAGVGCADVHFPPTTASLTTDTCEICRSVCSLQEIKNHSRIPTSLAGERVEGAQTQQHIRVTTHFLMTLFLN